MKVFTKVLAFLLYFDLLVFSYSSKTPISEASCRFIQIVLDNYCRASGDLWLQHGVIIRGDQRRPTSCNPEEYVTDDVIIWDPCSVCPALTLWCPNCIECGAVNQPLRATGWKDGKTTCDEP